MCIFVIYYSYCIYFFYTVLYILIILKMSLKELIIGHQKHMGKALSAGPHMANYKQIFIKNNGGLKMLLFNIILTSCNNLALNPWEPWLGELCSCGLSQSVLQSRQQFFFSLFFSSFVFLFYFFRSASIECAAILANASQGTQLSQLGLLLFLLRSKSNSRV